VPAAGNISPKRRVTHPTHSSASPDLPRPARLPIFRPDFLCVMRLRHALFLLVLAAAPLKADAAVVLGGEPTPIIRLDLVDEQPRAFRLAAPRPNPFSSQTRFELSLDESDEVTVAVHDALGRRVALLHDGALRPGTYTLSLNANGLPPGLYLIRATDGRGTTATRSVALTR